MISIKSFKYLEKWRENEKTVIWLIYRMAFYVLTYQRETARFEIPCHNEETKLYKKNRQIQISSFPSSFPEQNVRHM